MKKISMILLAAACILCSCKKDEEKEMVTLGVSMEDVNGGQKAYIDNNRYICFADGDVMKINNVDVTLNGTQARRDNDNAKHGQIMTYKSSSYLAVYPKSVLNQQASISGTTNVDVVLPEVQTYTTKSMGGSIRQVVDMPMCAYLNSREGTLNFHNLCSVLKVIVKNTKNITLGVTSITVRSSDSYLCGSGKIDNLTSSTPSIVMKNTNTTANREVRLQMSSAVNVETGGNKEFYIVIPAVSSTSNRFTVEVIADSIADGIPYANRYTKKQGASATGSIARNKLGSAAFNFTPQLPPDQPYIILDCNPSGVQQRVIFAPGNLQYRASDQTWQFAAHSYDFIGGVEIAWENGYNHWGVGFGAPASALTGNNTPITKNDVFAYQSYNCLNSDANFSTNYPGGLRHVQTKWIDLFGWGTSGKYDLTSTNVNAQNQPWCYFNNNWGGHNYDSDYGPAGTTTALTGNWDWGANTIYNPRTSSNETGWRTPTKDEWACLISSTSKFGYACFVDRSYYDASAYPNQGRLRYLSGIVLIPEGFVDPMCAQSDGNTSVYNRKFKTSSEFDIQGIFTQNIYRIADWVKMEAAGAVFLPSCGVRGGMGVGDAAEVNHGGQKAQYWSSTPDPSNPGGAYCFRMENGGYDSEHPATAMVESSGRSAGNGVRLIKTVAAD